jgi:fructokinase
MILQQAADSRKQPGAGRTDGHDGARVMVCGEALVDTVLAADGSGRLIPGGGPYNTARALSRLGVPTAFLARLSNDALGLRLMDALLADSVDVSMVSIGSEPTTLAIANLDPDGQADYSFYIDGTSSPHLTPVMLPECLGSGVMALHVGSLGLVLEPMASTLFDLIERESTLRLVMLDPNVRPGLVSNANEYRQRLESVMACSALVKASDADLEWIYPGVDIKRAIDRIAGLGPRVVIATLGPNGALGVTQGTHVKVDAAPVEIVDTIGAGDAYGAALLAWLHNHNALTRELAISPNDLETALMFASRVAGLTCTRVGADSPRREELLGAESALTTSTRNG